MHKISRLFAISRVVPRSQCSLERTYFTGITGLMGDWSPILLFLLISLTDSEMIFKKWNLFLLFFKEITSARNKEAH